MRASVRASLRRKIPLSSEGRPAHAARRSSERLYTCALLPVNRKSVVHIARTALSEPGTASLDIDDPATTEFRRQLVGRKPFLKAIYSEWYSILSEHIPTGDGRILEVGSGPGFFRDVRPEIITSEVVPSRGVDVAADGIGLPFREASLKAIVMVDVLHHMPNARQFLSEAVRSLRSGGRVLMIEPWVSSWSRLIYRHLHHEPFMPDAVRWEFPSGGPLSAANGALPWMIFQRDRQLFEAEYPDLQLDEVRPMMPFRYLLSGGVSMRAVVPSWSFPLFRWVESTLGPAMSHLAMFAFIALQRR